MPTVLKSMIVGLVSGIEPTDDLARCASADVPARTS